MRNEQIMFSYSCQNPRKKFRIGAEGRECSRRLKDYMELKSFIPSSQSRNRLCRDCNYYFRVLSPASRPIEFAGGGRGQAWRLLICGESNYHATCILVLHIKLGSSGFLRTPYCWHSRDYRNHSYTEIACRTEATQSSGPIN